MIVGPSTLQSYDVVKYYVQGLDAGNTAVSTWGISQDELVKIISQTGIELKLEIGQVRNNVSFNITYEGTEALQNIITKPFV